MDKKEYCANCGAELSGKQELVCSRACDKALDRQEQVLAKAYEEANPGKEWFQMVESDGSDW